MSSGVVDVLLIGGRSGVGKTTISYEVSEQLRRHDVAHVLVNGDNLDEVHPKVDGSDLAEVNLAAIWRNYRALGHHRLIYVNTVSVLEDAWIGRALGDEVETTGVLLQASDATIRERLERREIGSTLDVHLERSSVASARLASKVPDWVHGVSTDGRAISDIAEEVLRLAGWVNAAER